MLYQFIYSFLLPPGIFIIILFAFGLWLFSKKNKRAGKIAFIIALALYLVSTSFLSYPLLQSLENRYAPPAKIDGDVIIMLAGGATFDTVDIDGIGMLSGSAANRLLTTARLYRTTSLPIILSGNNLAENSESEIARRQLISLGIPEDKIILDNTSRNTKENAENTYSLLVKQNFSRPILVTSAFHMERSLKEFAKYSVSPVPFPTDFMRNKQFNFRLMSFAPSSASLAATSIVAKEYLGLLALALGR